MERMEKEIEKYEKFVVAMLFAGMIICAGVLFFYAKYNFLFNDDYSYAGIVRNIWKNDIPFINKLGGGIL